jgi:DMSO/TMAO reductase YedYZ molybdopterin-dependent catalytic subunit
MDDWNADLVQTSFLSRRTFLRGAAALPLAWSSARLFADAPGEGKPTEGLIPREKDPDNLEFPFTTLDRFLTPADLFYVRSHFDVPKIEAAGWRLKVEGAVERPLELTLAQLRELPERTLPATLECAGNGRAYLVPKAKGVPWELGAVSTAEWTGVPLAALLDRAGVKSGAVEVVLEGADKGEVKNEPKPTGPLHFARSLPLVKARTANEVLLAYKMNGATLPAAHGFPLRAVVGGWFGMASIKWLTRIIVVDKPFGGYFQMVDYSTWQRRDGLPVLTPITAGEVKASIARPAANDVVPANAEYRIHGAAWAGESEVAKVEVSTDGGRVWSEAKLLGKTVPLCWRLWEFAWKTPAGGKPVLMARATDSRGRTQPLDRDPDRRNYVISHVLPVPVEVRGA